MVNNNLSKLGLCSGKVESPISEEKLKSCYSCNGDIYPLCKGKVEKSECISCNVYEG